MTATQLATSIAEASMNTLLYVLAAMVLIGFTVSVFGLRDAKQVLIAMGAFGSFIALITGPLAMHYMSEADSQAAKNTQLEKEKEALVARQDELEGDVGRLKESNETLESEKLKLIARREELLSEIKNHKLALEEARKQKEGLEPYEQSVKSRLRGWALGTPMPSGAPSRNGQVHPGPLISNSSKRGLANKVFRDRSTRGSLALNTKSWPQR
jgi:hypothetical protein